MRRLLFPAAAFLALATGAIRFLAPAPPAPPQAPVFFHRRLEPAAGVLLHGAGQTDNATFLDYTLLLGPNRPMLFMSYVDLKDDLPAFFSDLTSALDRYPDFLVPQIGLSLNQGSAALHYESEVATPAFAPRIAQLCTSLQRLDRPVFLRIGYEFNADWNGYAAAPYAAAFRTLATAVHACAPMVATVWDYAPDAASTAPTPFYPGDSAVDWWAINLFSEKDFDSASTRAFMAAALSQRFPVMVAESTPRRVPVTLGQDAVSRWFRPYFDFLLSHPQVKAFCYINWDWRRYPQWADWGDARIQQNSTVQTFYLNQFRLHRFQPATTRSATLDLLHLQPVASRR